MATKKPRDKAKSAKSEQSTTCGRIFVPTPSFDSTCPFALNTKELLLTTARAFPPPDRGRDRTKGDRERFKERMKGKLDKEKLKDIIKNNPVFGDKGKIRVPTDGGKEPRWRPGRDPKGGGKGRKAGGDPGDLVYIDIDYDEFVEWLFEDLELPFLMKTDNQNILVPIFRIRGYTDSGPDARTNWEESEINRISRAMAMLNADRNYFPVLNDFVIDALISAVEKLKSTISASTTVALLTGAVAALGAVKEKKQEALPLTDEALTGLAAAASMLAQTYHELHLDDDLVHRLARFVDALRLNPTVLPTLDPETDIPTQMDCPFIDDDLVFHRVEISYEPDSKAVVFLVLDRSGSMGGDPLAIAKFYFLLNILFLRTRYKEVHVIMIAHDAQAYEIEDEQKFYQIEVDGGTMFVPAYEKVLDIAVERYPISSWNRYMFHATDGYMFDGDDEITAWWTRLISKDSDGGTFRFCGYLEIDPSGGRVFWGNQGNGWAPGGQALLRVDEETAKHIGMARVSSMDQVLDAFKAILTKDTEATP